MSLSNPNSWVAELRKHTSPLSPPAGPDFQPPSKRLRLEEPGAAPEAGWRLPLVPRLSEVEKVWELSPCRPLSELFLSADVLLGNVTESGGETSAPGAPRCEVGWRESRSHGSPRRPSLPTPSVDPLSASRSFAEAGDLGFRAPSGDRPEAEGRQLLPNAPGTRGRLEVKGGKHLAAQDSDSRQTVGRHLKQTPSPLLDVTFCKKTRPEPRGIQNRCQADRVMPPNNENNTSVFTLKISKRQNLPSMEIAKPSYFRESSTISIPDFPTDLNSKMSSVYLEEMAKKKNDINEAYVRDFTNIYWSQNRPDVKQKLQDDNKSVAAENIFPKCYESSPQSLSNQNTCVRKKDLISLNHYNKSRLDFDTRHSGNKVTIIVENENWKELVSYLDCYMSTTILKNFQTLETRDYNTRSIFIKNIENFIMNNYGAKYQTMKKTGENFGFLQLLEVGPLSTEDYYNVKVMKTYEEQPKSLMIGMQSSQKTLIHYFWLNNKEENDNILQLRYNATQKVFYLSSIFENFITEIFCFYKSILGIQNNNNILTWYEILTCKKQVGVQNLVTRNMNANRKHNILGLCLQTSVTESLKFILKTNIDSLLNNADISTIDESDSKLGQAYIFKWIVHLNYPRNVTESHIIHLERILMFSGLLEDTLKPMLEKRKLFKSENVFEKSNDKKFYSSSMTIEIAHLQIFETYKKTPLLMNFDDMNRMFSTKEIAYNSDDSCPEQLMVLENRPHCITNAVQTCIQFDPQSIQCINENCYEVSIYSQDLANRRKHESKKMSSFTFKCISDDNFNIRQHTISKNQDIKFREEINLAPITQIIHFGNLLSENEGKEYNLILKEEEKVTAQSLTHSFLVQQDSKIGKKEKNAFLLMNCMFPVQSVLLMNEKICKGETNRYIDQNTITDDNEYESILQESELVNSKHFYPKNDSTESENYQFDLSVANKECFQDLTAKCLSTEALTIVKDFEMKSKFDLVLEELRMFHEISKENEILNTAETNNGQENYSGENNDIEEVKMKIKEDLKMGTVNKICASSFHCDNRAASSLHKRHQSLFKWKVVPEKREQEVPEEYCSPRTSEEELFYPTEEVGANSSAKRPALVSDELNEEKFHHSFKGGSNFSNGISRVLPLKTCSRPIRIGLSRKAKLKQLHPYLK
ncbi:RAD51-associated protein 2 [Sorex araneus]|uniref:RAD51-associated protein 2 n=1 Tax=Sorex araneus TaxID=42254 RepID=UPI0024337178|nr:RAD51-associated protein 2 [Sorex araneus]